MNKITCVIPEGVLQNSAILQFVDYPLFKFDTNIVIMSFGELFIIAQKNNNENVFTAIKCFTDSDSAINFLYEDIQVV